MAAQPEPGIRKHRVLTCPACKFQAGHHFHCKAPAYSHSCPWWRCARCLKVFDENGRVLS